MLTNKAAYMTGLRKLEFRDIPVQEPKAGHVLVKLEYIGVCGSDLHYYEHGRIGDFVVNGDFILGHECAGEVVKAGEGVTCLKPGDRVALEPGVTCGECEFCKTGRYNLCPAVEFLATPPYHGCFENYISFPANMAFKLPENVSSKEGALVEPLCVGLEAAREGGVSLGSRVIILGAGCIGLTALLASKAYGATDITVVDVIQKRLDKAMEMGATRVINAASEDIVKKYMDITAGQGAQIVMETAGAEITTQQTVSLVARGGAIVLVGMAPKDTFGFNFAKLMGSVANIKTIFRYKNLFPTAISAVESGAISLSGLVTHEYKFEDLAAALDAGIDNKEETVKIVIKM